MCLGYCDNCLPLVSSMWLLHPGYSMCNTIGGLCSPGHGCRGPLLHILHCSFHLENNLSLHTMLVSLLVLGGAAIRAHLFESVNQSSSLTGKLQKARLGLCGRSIRIRGNDFQSGTSYELPKVRGSRHMGSEGAILLLGAEKRAGTCICFLFSDFCGLVHLSSFSLLSAPLISRGGKKPFYFNIPRTSDFWSVRASGILLTLPRC